MTNKKSYYQAAPNNRATIMMGKHDSHMTSKLLLRPGVPSIAAKLSTRSNTIMSASSSASNNELPEQKPKISQGDVEKLRAASNANGAYLNYMSNELKNKAYDKD